MPDERDWPKFQARKNPYKFRCNRCGKLFEAKRRDAIFCSPKCRKYASRQPVTLFPTK